MTKSEKSAPMSEKQVQVLADLTARCADLFVQRDLRGNLIKITTKRIDEIFREKPIAGIEAERNQ